MKNRFQPQGRKEIQLLLAERNPSFLSFATFVLCGWLIHVRAAERRVTIISGFFGYNRNMNAAIRRGGKQTRDGFLFELSGGDLALDFVNTVDSRPTESPHELLPTYKDLLSWSRQAGVVSKDMESRLLNHAARHAKEAESVRRLAVSARECLFGIFRCVASGHKAPRDLLKKWNGFVHKAMGHFELVPDHDGFTWTSQSNDHRLDSILWPVIDSAHRLLTNSNLSRIRRCAAENCDWLFLDTSKRGNRRWCDMSVCGNRAKAQRFYAKRKNH